MIAAAVLVLASAAGVTACSAPGASQERQVSTRSAVAPVTRDSAAADGGYACLRDTGNAGGECDNAMLLPLGHR